jgi:pimeloyl-ACP methyl ester carboxylesterase
MIILLACLAVVLGALYAFQRKLIYLPNRISREDFEDTVKGAFDDRVSVLAPFDAIVFEPPPTVSVRGTAILFHGNAGLGLDRAYLAPTFARRGLRLILAEYPGYGARGGAPTEKALVDDAEALYVKVSLRYPNSPIVLVGESLGGGVVVQVAARAPARTPSRLLLLTPFLSLAETAARAYRFRPARYLVRDRFDSAGQLPRYTGTVAILVAGRDEVLGADQGRALAQLSRSRGETVYVEVPEAGHNSWTALITDAQWTELLGMPPVRGGP